MVIVIAIVRCRTGSFPCGGRQRLQLRVLEMMHETRPVLLPGHTQHLDDFLHLVPLKGRRLLVVQLRLLALEDRAQAQQFREDAADRPEVDGGRVVLCPQQQFGRPVPDRHHHLVAREERVERFMEDAGQAEVADADLSAGGHHYVGGFEVPVQHPIRVEVVHPIQELPEHRFHCGGRDRGSLLRRMGGGWGCWGVRVLGLGLVVGGRGGVGAGVVLDDLEEVMLAILEYHEDAFLLQDDLGEVDDIWVRELRAEGHFPDGGLGDAGVLNLLILFVGLESGSHQLLGLGAMRGLVQGTESYFLMAKSPLMPLMPTALYTLPYVPLLMKPTILYRSSTWTLLI